MVSLMSFVLP
jgi:hypothetical protein